MGQTHDQRILTDLLCLERHHAGQSIVINQESLHFLVDVLLSLERLQVVVCLVGSGHLRDWRLWLWWSQRMVWRQGRWLCNVYISIGKEENNNREDVNDEDDEGKQRKR